MIKSILHLRDAQKYFILSRFQPQMDTCLKNTYTHLIQMWLLVCIPTLPNPCRYLLLDTLKRQFYITKCLIFASVASLLYLCANLFDGLLLVD